MEECVLLHSLEQNRAGGKSHLLAFVRKQHVTFYWLLAGMSWKPL